MYSMQKYVTHSGFYRDVLYSLIDFKWYSGLEVGL